MDNSLIKEGEVTEEIDGGYLIIANPSLYRYTSDSVRLAKAVKAGAGERILDMCSGGGIIALTIAALTKATVDGVEINAKLCDMAKRSVLINSLSERVNIIRSDIKEFNSTRQYDKIVCNPPYYPIGSGEMRSGETIDTARHELLCCLDDVVSAAERNLKFGGDFYLIHKCERMSEVIYALKSRLLEPKRLIVFHHSERGDSFIVISKKGARPGMTVTVSEL